MTITAIVVVMMIRTIVIAINASNSNIPKGQQY